MKGAFLIAAFSFGGLERISLFLHLFGEGLRNSSLFFRRFLDTVCNKTLGGSRVGFKLRVSLT